MASMRQTVCSCVRVCNRVSGIQNSSGSRTRLQSRPISSSRPRLNRGPVRRFDIRHIIDMVRQPRFARPLGPPSTYTMDDLEHTSLPPYEFYHLKPGAARTHKVQDHGDDSRRSPVLGFIPRSWLPLTPEDLPLIQRLIIDVWKLCPSLWIIYSIVQVTSALLPALELYFSGQLFTVIQTAIDERHADRSIMIKAALGTASCNAALRLLMRHNFQREIMAHISSTFKDKQIRAQAHLDLPTSTDRSSLASGILGREGGSTPWTLVSKLISLFSLTLQVSTQLYMLLRLLRRRPESTSLVILSFVDPIIKWLEGTKATSYVVTKKRFAERRDIIERIVAQTSDLRKEIVVNNLSEWLTKEYKHSKPSISSSLSSDEVWERHVGKSYSKLLARALRGALAEGPKIAFALKALNTPAHVPLSLAMLTVVQSQVNKFTDVLFQLLGNKVSLRWQLDIIRELYKLDLVPNIVKDGYKSFSKFGQGVSVEFKGVTFKYPDQDTPAIANMSFRLEAGSLCVIVGANGEGKSSILKALTRLYDPADGEILLDDEPIRNFVLQDLRRATSVLFQDYALFPFSIGENISIGDISTADHSDEEQEERIRRAAELGGASKFISALPLGYETTVKSENEYTEMHGPESSYVWKTVLAQDGQRRERRKKSTGLSGGQEQRLALSRTFMKSPGDTSLLIYDEPSASLDPQAEFDLFERLKALRGSKTMIFSTHRFGYLTKYADVILYLKDSTIAESGTHSELMKRGQGYAQLYNLQAGAFTA